MKYAKTLMAFAAAAVATVAMAAVTYDPASGTGFVGKGDVQLAFGYNNAGFQAVASDVSFEYRESVTYSYDCALIQGNSGGAKIYARDIPVTTSINNVPAFDVRTNKQVNGYNLTGKGVVSSTGQIPVEGSPCSVEEGSDGDNKNNLKIYDVQVVSSTGTLFAVIGGNAQPLN